MKIALCCDVDPVLPARLGREGARDPWKTLDGVEALASAGELPPITWLIRSDESVRFASGDYASGYLERRGLWDALRARGHELGWHMHLLSADPATGIFRFDPRPAWLERAHEGLSRHFPVAATRTGWDYASAWLFERLDALGVRVDLSALPGNRHWFAGGVCADWLACREGPYHPGRGDYQRSGPSPLRLLEVPVAQFRDGPAGVLRRAAWRLLHGCASPAGLRNKTRLMTDPWPGAPRLGAEAAALFFHPSDLTPRGIAAFRSNLQALRGLKAVRFVRASELASEDSRPLN